MINYIYTLLDFPFSQHRNQNSGQALTIANGRHQQCLPLLEVRGIAPEQQPLVGGFLLRHSFVQSGKHLLFLRQTSIDVLIPQSERV